MKHLLAILFAVAVTFASRAGLLYWMIDQSQSDSPIEFSYARIVAVPGSVGEQQYLTVGSDPANGYVQATGVTEANPLGSATGVVYTDLSGLSGTDYSFFIELYSMATGQEVKVGQSEMASYSQLVASIYENGLSSLPTLEKVWSPAVNVPEPTSGVLMLFGLAALGLRRRRALGC